VTASEAAANPRPFRFGVQASRTVDGASWIELAKRVEGCGYSVLTMPDHFDDQFAPVPALMAAATATEALRVGALVWDNDYKHPVVLAKELATIDVLSDGRLEVGIGAGWLATDYERSGMSYDRPGVRIDRFVEALDVLDGAFSDGPFDLRGEHYTISGLDALPKPVQRPRPPLLIGGGGRRVLTVAAQRADIVGVNGTLHAGAIGPEALESMTAEAVDAKVDIVRQAGAARLDEIEMNIRVFMVNVTDDRAAAINGLAGLLGVQESLIDQSPFALIGSTAQMAQWLRERRERWGFSYIIVGHHDVEAFAPVVAELAGT
jgi:probable F420-dependent oxidoreductase